MPFLFNTDKNGVSCKKSAKISSPPTSCDIILHWRMKLEQILPMAIPILTLVLGWCLNSLTPVFNSRRENRKALAKVIADLFEIRHGFLAWQFGIEEAAKLVTLTPDG